MGPLTYWNNFKSKLVGKNAFILAIWRFDYNLRIIYPNTATMSLFLLPER